MENETEANTASALVFLKFYSIIIFYISRGSRELTFGPNAFGAVANFTFNISDGETTRSTANSKHNGNFITTHYCGIVYDFFFGCDIFVLTALAIDIDHSQTPDKVWFGSRERRISFNLIAVPQYQILGSRGNFFSAIVAFYSFLFSHSNLVERAPPLLYARRVIFKTKKKKRIKRSEKKHRRRENTKKWFQKTYSRRFNLFFVVCCCCVRSSLYEITALLLRMGSR